MPEELVETTAVVDYSAELMGFGTAPRVTSFSSKEIHLVYGDNTTTTRYKSAARFTGREQFGHHAGVGTDSGRAGLSGG